MITALPVLGPDELLYGGVAYAYDMSGLRSQQTLMELLFSKRFQGKEFIILPKNINHLVSIMRGLHNYSVDEILNDHTMFRLYSAFLPRERAAALKRNLVDGYNGSMFSQLGLNGLRIPLDVSLHFCPVCRADDIFKHGRPFWHRIHHIPMTRVCPVHAVFLEKSRYEPTHKRLLLSADNGTFETSARPLDLTDQMHKLLFRVAQAGAWLLENNTLPIETNDLVLCYHIKLAERGFATYDGHIINHVNLNNDFHNIFSHKFLERICCPIPESERLGNNWLYLLLQNKVYFHLYHLLMILYCSPDFDAFLADIPRLIKKSNPFGKGPWPCLNKASDHYGELHITQIRMTYRSDRKKRFAVLSCSCGYSYQVYESSHISNTHFVGKSIRIITVGQIWEERLRQEWENRVSILQLTKTMGVPRSRLKKEATRLGLLSKSGIELSTILPEMRTQITNHHRLIWLKLKADNPTWGRNTIGTVASSAHRWLLREDRQWLDEQSPSLNRKGSVKPRTSEKFTALPETRTQITNHHRLIWLKLKADNPTWGRSKISGLANTTYLWLLREDKQWLDEQSPSLNRKGSVKPLNTEPKDPGNKI